TPERQLMSDIRIKLLVRSIFCPNQLEILTRLLPCLKINLEHQSEHRKARNSHGPDNVFRISIVAVVIMITSLLLCLMTLSAIDASPNYSVRPARGLYGVSDPPLYSLQQMDVASSNKQRPQPEEEHDPDLAWFQSVLDRVPRATPDQIQNLFDAMPPADPNLVSAFTTITNEWLERPLPDHRVTYNGAVLDQRSDNFVGRSEDDIGLDAGIVSKPCQSPD
ncbi:hypothetical protein BVRB_033460, partial [Beta vulgaris subsp. vulgaris]